MDQTTASIVILRFISRWCKERQCCIQEAAAKNGCCGKLVTAFKGGRLKTWRCYGADDGSGCYNCDYSGNACICGNSIATGTSFCSGSCQGMYYNY